MADPIVLSEKISIDYVMTPDEIRAWSRYRINPLCGWPALPFALVSIGLGIAGLLAGVVAAGALAASGALLGLLALRAQVAAAARTRRVLWRPRPAVRTWEFTIESVGTRCGADHQVASWARFTGVGEWRQFVVLRAGRRRHDVLIPRRAFSSLESIATLRLLAREKVSDLKETSEVAAVEVSVG